MKIDYSLLSKQLVSLIEDQSNHTAVLANTSALLNQTLDNINWVGFYLAVPDSDDLVLGPFQGNVACYHIPFGQGVCGVAALTLETQRIDDVHQFSGNIACDAGSQSELVIPLVINGKLYGVLDIDSPNLSNFNQNDQQGLEIFVEQLVNCLTA